MRHFFLLILFSVFTSGVSFGQEICDNAIDDDGDGLIDLNDDECECGGAIEIESLIPNHSFEEHSCCPMGFSQMTCADTWIQASAATSDYYNFCGIDGPEEIFGGVILNPEFPLPGDGTGAGYAGFISQQLDGIGEYNEYIGACLLGPMLAGTTYILNLYLARSIGEPDLNLSIYGTPDCGDLPWAGFLCPDGVGSWELLSETMVTLDPDLAWQEVTISFVPTIDINAIAIGGGCDPPDVGLGAEYNYYYLDELTLLDFDSFYGMEQEGGWCSGDLILTAETDTVGGTWQWYKDGIALIGETNEDFNPLIYGEGDFDAVYWLDDYCSRLSYSSPEAGIIADFASETFCFPGVTVFENTSVYDDPDGVWWDWDLGDGTTTTDESPVHEYASPGGYDVTLIAHSVDESCNDTLNGIYYVTPKPVAAFDLTAESIYTWAGHEVVCMNNLVSFIDESTVDAPSEIVAWTWDFGDGGTSDLQNPDYLYTDYGIFDISLIVETDSGCKDTTAYEELFITAIFPDFTTEDECALDEVNFENTSTLIDPEDFDTWEWDFGDGGTATTEDATHTYTTPGVYTVELIAVTEEGCTDTVESTVEIYPVPVSDLEFIVDGISSEDGGTGGCYTSEVQFNSLATIAPPSVIISWLWDFGDGTTSALENPTHLYDSEGPYTVELTVVTDFGCQHTFNLDILMTNGLAFLSNDTTICQNGTAIAQAISSDGGIYIYDWNIPGADNGPDQLVEGLTEDFMVYVTATNAVGCVSPMDSMLISVNEPITLEITPFDTACLGQSSGATVTVTGGDGAYNYSWTANGVPMPDNAPIINTTPYQTTEYCVTVSDGCETTPVDICTETYVPEYVVFTSDTTEGCEPTEITFTDLTGPDATLNESTWYMNGTTLYGNPVSYVFEEAGTYTVSLDVLSPEGCTTRGTVNGYITIHPLPNPELYITPNPTTYFNTIVEGVNINPDFGSTFEWHMPGGTPEWAFSDSLVEIKYPELISGNYDITLIETTQYNCVDSVTQTLIINNDQIIYAPNTFTPDGDNFNDTWGIYIEGIDPYDFHLTVFNRWGEIVWESHNPGQRWDGAYGGELVQDGVYVWTIQTKDLENDKAYEFKGTVNVLK